MVLVRVLQAGRASHAATTSISKEQKQIAETKRMQGNTEAVCKFVGRLVSMQPASEAETGLLRPGQFSAFGKNV